jgi:hypothetical protein
VSVTRKQLVKTEDFICAAVIVIFECKPVKLLYIIVTCSYKLCVQVFSETKHHL